MRVNAERKGSTLRADCRIAENPVARGVTFDVVEKHRRAFCHAGGDFGDAADFEHRVGAVDAAQRTEAVDEVNEFAQVAVHNLTFLRKGQAPSPTAGICSPQRLTAPVSMSNRTSTSLRLSLRTTSAARVSRPVVLP